MSQLNTREILKHIVDLRRSKWDKERTDRHKGKYHFTEKVYVKDSDYRDDTIRPDYVFQFVGFSEQDPQSGFGYWQMHYSAEPVTESDEYWPEPLIPDSNGHYKFVDSILVKVPVGVWVDKVIADRKRYDKSAQDIQKSFREQAAAAGCGAKDSDF